MEKSLAKGLHSLQIECLASAAESLPLGYDVKDFSLGPWGAIVRAIDSMNLGEPMV